MSKGKSARRASRKAKQLGACERAQASAVRLISPAAAPLDNSAWKIKVTPTVELPALSFSTARQEHLVAHERLKRAARVMREWEGHRRAGRDAEAEACERAAWTIDRGFYNICAGMSYVETGDYALGWSRVEAGCAYGIRGGGPRWDGGKLTGALVIFVGSSPMPGLGDQIVFARFVKMIRARGVQRIVILCERPLLRLFGRIPGVNDVYEVKPDPTGFMEFQFPPGERPGKWIEWAALPHMFGIKSIDAVPREPYLTADQRDIVHWGPRLPQQGLRVGLVWRTWKHAQDAKQREVPLALLGPLWEVPGVSFVSLQKGVGEDEARASALPLTLVDDKDLADTAAVIANLDLVIGADVCVTNLSGAMGVQTWLLSAPMPGFRWRHNWYPSARLFRPDTEIEHAKIGPADYLPVVQNVRDALREFAASRPSTAGRAA